MDTPTDKMLTKVEEWKAGYRELILKNTGRPEETEMEAGQYRRLTVVENYLEERRTRHVEAG